MWLVIVLVANTAWLTWEPREYRRPTPRALDADEQRLVRELELYEASDEPDAVRAKLVHANVLRRADQLEAANPLYLDIVAKHPDHAVAEAAANFALDGLNRLERFDELVAMTERMRADPCCSRTDPSSRGSCVRSISSRCVPSPRCSKARTSRLRSRC